VILKVKFEGIESKETVLNILHDSHSTFRRLYFVCTQGLAQRIIASFPARIFFSPFQLQEEPD